MTEIRLLAQRLIEPPCLAGRLDTPIIDSINSAPVTFVVIEAGMASGEPSVSVVAPGAFAGTLHIQVSLDKLLMAAQGLATMAETRFGWTRPEGMVTILPPDPVARRALLESIRDELAQWDAFDEGVTS